MHKSQKAATGVLSGDRTQDVLHSCAEPTTQLPVAILAQVASAAWAKVRARVRSAGDGVRAGLGQPATFTRGGAPLRPQIR